jgi:ketol-acid reductoisomerase
MLNHLTPNPQLILDRIVAIIGYGSQGSAHAQNLRDSGVHVIIGARDLSSASAQQAQSAGFETLPLQTATEAADLIMVLTPDETQREVFTIIAPALTSGKALAFAHGFAVHFAAITPPSDIDVIMVAPKGVGPAVRARYLAGTGVAGLIAVHQDSTGHAHDLALSYAWANGHTRVAVFDTTFKEECEADLFSEQAVIVGGLTELLLAGYHTLVDAGYQPEIAYFECVHEAKLILDLIVERGFAGMFELISNTAEYGAQTAGTKIITNQTKATMRTILTQVQDGTFAQAWTQEYQAGMPHLLAQRAHYATDPIEPIAEGLRSTLSS